MATDATPNRDLAGAPSETRRKTLLVVDDDDALRWITCAILEAQGYVVLQADSGPAALRVAETRGPVDLLLTDITMPGMNGWDLAARLEESIHGLRVVFMSGVGYQALVRRRRLPAPFLQKPFDVEALLGSIRSVLGVKNGRA